MGRRLSLGLAKGVADGVGQQEYRRPALSPADGAPRAPPPLSVSPPPSRPPAPPPAAPAAVPLPALLPPPLPASVAASLRTTAPTAPPSAPPCSPPPPSLPPSAVGAGASPPPTSHAPRWQRRASFRAIRQLQAVAQEALAQLPPERATIVTRAVAAMRDAPSVTGALRRQLDNWKSHPHATRWHVKAVARGVDPWEFASEEGSREKALKLPPRPSAVRDPAERAWVALELVRQLEDDLLAPAGKKQPCLVEPLFTVPKSGPKWRRLVHSLTRQNQYLDPPSFKLENLTKAAELCRPGYWGATLDVSGAFNHLQCTPQAGATMAMELGGVRLLSRVQGFGCSATPYLFHKATLPLRRAVRARGVVLVMYVDDALILAETREECEQGVLIFKEEAARCGWILDEKKESAPATRFEFLGAILDTQQASLEIAKAKRQALVRALDKILQLPPTDEQALEAMPATAEDSPPLAAIITDEEISSPPSPPPAEQLRVSFRDLAMLGGKFTSLRAACPVLGVACGPLYQALNRMYAKGHLWDDAARLSAQLNAQIVADLRFVRRLLLSCAPRGHLWPREHVSVVHTSDASSTAWGAHLGSETAPTTPGIKGTFPRELLSSHVATKEAFGVLAGLYHYQDQVKGKVVVIRTDSVWVRSALVRSWHARAELNEVLRRIALLLARLDASLLSAQWIPSAANERADRLSRETDPHSYGLKEDHLRLALSLFEPQSATIDMFAASWNHRLERFASLLDFVKEVVEDEDEGEGASAAATAPPRPLLRANDSPAPVAADAFCATWAGERVYAHPPLPILAKVLAFIELHRDPLDVVLVCPHYITASWWPVLARLATRHIVLGEAEEVMRKDLSFPRNGRLPPGQWLAVHIQTTGSAARCA